MARGIAALAVLFEHVRSLFFVPYHELRHHSAALAAYYAMTTLGHQAVIIFFVLSGFFIVSSVISSFEDHRWSWSTYLVSRTVRLSLVLIPALIFCAIVDHIGMALTSTSALYHGPVGNVVTTGVAESETLRNFIGSFFYVQSILVRPFGSDGPLWSLSYEFWYYILFPIGVCALTRRFRPTARVMYCVFAALIVFFVGPTIALYFLIWLLGGAIAILSIRGWVRVRSMHTMVSAAAVMPLACVLGFSVVRPMNSPFLTDGIVAIGFGIWVYSLVGLPEKSLAAFYKRTARFLAGFSYTLYLTHFPVVFFMRASILHGALWQPDLVHIVYAISVAMGAVAVAYGIAQGTEAKTAAVRHRVMELLHPMAQPARQG